MPHTFDYVWGISYLYRLKTKNMQVYVLTRIQDGDVVVDGVFRKEETLEEYKKELLEQWGEEDEDSWETHVETLQ